MRPSLRMEVTHGGHVGHVRRQVLESAERLGAGEVKAGEAAIVATELASNLVKHGQGGEILLNELEVEGAYVLEMHALDKGPGMVSVNACLRDGFSTAGSAGTGLGAVQRLAGQFQIHSQPGQGTAVWVHFPLVPDASRAAARKFICSGVSVALKGEDMCGDSWDFRESADGLQVLLADGLGHGPFAAEASREAVSVFRRHARISPSECLSLAHQALFKTRGAAASTVSIDPEGCRLVSSGIGNVTMRVLGDAGAKTLHADNGTLGASVRKVQEMPHPWKPDSLLILHSDGISSRWDLEKYPGLIRRHPGLVAGVIYRDHRHQHDDATVVVIRQSAS
ncbi:MAG: serine/threonine protein kinase [Verrucomicrobiales bacterium]|nr:serine/threonine protein kinase [Verrucomicrobiales bacterium]